MRKLTGRVASSLAGAAILLSATCSERTQLFGSGGTSGAGSVVSTGGSSGYWQGDGIAPRGGGGASGGSLGTGGVDPNCFMRCGQGNAISYSSGGAGGSLDARTVASDSSAMDCESRRQVYYAAVVDAGQCDPTATVPCAAWDGVECPTVGVNPDSLAALGAKFSDYKAAGCSLPMHSCPIVVMTPAPYTCQPDGDGGYRCYSVCESMMGGRATCVNEASGCKTMTLSAGFCGTAMVCCSPFQ
jgi:hypothetical protein